MSMLLTIALRNIGRHKRRTILSAITMACGLMFFICMNSMVSGVDRMSIDNLIELSAGSLKLQTKEYDREKDTYPLDYGIESSAPEITQLLSREKAVKAITKRTVFMGQLSNYTDVLPVVGTVVDQATDTAVFQLKTRIEGSYFSADNKREIIVGKSLARDLGVGVGDEITLYALTKYESRNADRFTVVGLLSTPDLAINRGSIFITYAAANDFLDLDNLVTELDISVVETNNFKQYTGEVRRIQKDLCKRFAALAVNSFMELGAGVMQVTAAKRMFGAIFMLVILIIAGVGIFNTVFMSVYERIREIGVLRAHGMDPGEITRMFFLESAITGLLGSLAGCAAGSFCNFFLVKNGFPLEKIGGQLATAQFALSGNVHGTWDIPAMAVVFFLGVIVASAAGIIPARRASKFQVTAAMRFQ